MLNVYKYSLRQSKRIESLRRKFLTLPHIISGQEELSLTQISSKISAKPRLQTKTLLKFKTPKVMTNFGLTLVTKAILSINVKRSCYIFTNTSTVEVRQLLDDEEGVTIGSIDLDERYYTSLEFDLTDAVQSWIIDPEDNKGVMVIVGDYLIDTTESNPTIFIETQFASIRQKRSVFLETLEEENNDETDCTATDKRCCRDSMIVNLKELEGFEFVVEPQELNAYMCDGKCPPIYHPLTEHYLLQSLVHLMDPEMTGMEERVRKPCCVAGKLSNLPVLHLDEENPTKLKVTTWRGVIVTQCGCG